MTKQITLSFQMDEQTFGVLQKIFGDSLKDLEDNLASMMGVCSTSGAFCNGTKKRKGPKETNVDIPRQEKYYKSKYGLSIVQTYMGAQFRFIEKRPHEIAKALGITEKRVKAVLKKMIKNGKINFIPQNKNKWPTLALAKVAKKHWADAFKKK